MATGRILLSILCVITCSSAQWQKGLHPSSENGFNDLWEAVRPVTLHTERKGNIVQISVKYQPHADTVPFWEIDIEGHSEVMHTLGRSRDEGGREFSFIEVNQEAVVTELYFHLSSRIGEVVIELNYQTLKVLDGEMDIPAVGVKPLVPPVYTPLSVESACIGQYIYVKFEKDSESDVDLKYGRDVQFTFVDNSYYENVLNRESTYFYHHFLEKKKHFYGMEIELKSEYVQNGSEVTATFKTYKTFDKTTSTYIKSVSKNVHSLIEPPDLIQYILFHDELGVFREVQNTIEISDKLEDRAIDCAVFGRPKPVVDISDPDGNVLPSTEVTLDNGMTTHVIASLENIPADQIEGDYKCIASNGVTDIEQTVTLTASSVQ